MIDRIYNSRRKYSADSSDAL